MFLCFLCFHGAVSNRGRHDRVGKARERARGKGATRQAHPAGARRPGAGHRSQQVWTLLRRPRSPLLVWLGTARHSLARPRKHQSKVGIVQDWFSITCWPHEETQNSSLTRSTPPTVHPLLVSVVLIEERNVFSFSFPLFRTKAQKKTCSSVNGVLPSFKIQAASAALSPQDVIYCSAHSKPLNKLATFH